MNQYKYLNLHLYFKKKVLYRDKEDNFLSYNERIFEAAKYIQNSILTEELILRNNLSSQAPTVILLKQNHRDFCYAVKKRKQDGSRERLEDLADFDRQIPNEVYNHNQEDIERELINLWLSLELLKYKPDDYNLDKWF